MTTLKENLTNRIKKLIKPGNPAQALQPFFEAVSNAIMAIDDRNDASATPVSGLVQIEIKGLGTDDIIMTIKDNGIGLDEKRYDAFCTVDTDYKSERGGKGVGRLYWLDAFRSVEVESRYIEVGELKLLQLSLSNRAEIFVTPQRLW